jgi:hypothetical protein
MLKIPPTSARAREKCQAVMGSSLTGSAEIFFQCGNKTIYMHITHHPAVIKHGLLEDSSLIENVPIKNAMFD